MIHKSIPVIDLFGGKTPFAITNKRARYAEVLHMQLILMHGFKEGTLCKHCIHLRRFGQGTRKWTKCSKATLEGHTASDWRTAWKACGLFETSKPDDRVSAKYKKIF